MATYLFRCPTENVVGPILPSTRGAPYLLFRHYAPTARGLAVLITDQVATEHRNPSTDQLEAVDTYYLGGRDHYIDGTAAGVLVDNGYSVTLIEDDAPSALFPSLGLYPSTDLFPDTD